MSLHSRLCAEAAITDGETLFEGKERELLLRPFSSIKGEGTSSLPPPLLLFLQGRKEGTHGNCSTRESGEEGLPHILPPKRGEARDCSACRDRIFRYLSMRQSVNLIPDPLHISPTTFLLLPPPYFLSSDVHRGSSSSHHPNGEIEE